MPLFEFICSKCGHRFEALVIGSQRPVCPLCRSAELEQVLSTFATSSGKGSRTPARPGPGCGAGSGGG